VPGHYGNGMHSANSNVCNAFFWNLVKNRNRGENEADTHRKQTKKKKKKKKKPHPSSLMQNKKLQKLQKSIWFSLCQEALLCWVFHSF
jgi:hypothetical protein